MFHDHSYLDNLFEKILNYFSNQRKRHSSASSFSSSREIFETFIDLVNNLPFLIISYSKSSKFKRQYKLLLVLKCLFSIKYTNINLGLSYYLEKAEIWKNFLEFYNHDSFDIRILWLQTAIVIIQTELKSSSILPLKERIITLLLDKEYNVRLKALDALTFIKHNLYSEEDFKAIFLRVGDILSEVRIKARSVLAIIFYEINKVIRISKSDRLLTIASFCLINYPSQDIVESRSIEQITQIDLFDVGSNIEKRALNFLELFIFSNAAMKKSLGKMLLKQKSNRQNLRDALCGKCNIHDVIKSFGVDESDEIFEELLIENNELRLTWENVLKDDSPNNADEVLTVMNSTENKELINIIAANCGLLLIDKELVIEMLKITDFDYKDLGLVIIFISNCYESILNDKRILAMLPDKLIKWLFIGKDYLKCNEEVIKMFEEKMRSIIEENL